MKEKNYNTVTLAELFWKALSRWWLIMACVAVGAFVMYKFASKNYDADVKAYEKDNSAYLAQAKLYNELYDFNTEYRKAETDAEKKQKAQDLAKFCKAHLTADQINSVNDALSIREQMEKTVKTRENQILQKVNPYSIPTVTLIYSVTPELPEQQSAINNYYLSAHNSQKIWTELYSYLDVAEEAYSDFQGCGTFAFTNGYQFTLSFCYDDLSAMEGIEKELERILSDYRKKVVRESGYQHELVKVEANIYTKSDTNVATQQNTYQQWIVDYSNRIQSLKNIFNYSPIQYNYYDHLVNLADGGDGYVTVRDMTKPKEDDAAAKMPSDPKKMALIGGAAGLVAGIAILLLIMLFAGRLQKAEELSDLFNLSLVGTLLGEGFQLPFEKLVKFFRTRRYGVFNVEKRIKHTALKIKAMCDDKNLKEIVISGTAASKRNKGLLEKLSKELNESGIKVSAIGNILTNSAAFDQAIKTKAVIFAEKEISSAYKNIEREILQVSGCDITLLGAICIY